MISFIPIQETDFPNIYKWLHTEHVKQWWENLPQTLEQVEEKYTKRMNEGIISTYIINVDNTPIGLIQSYVENDYEIYEINTPGVGIDLFIGESSYLGKGLGTKVIKTYIKDIVNKQYTQKFITIDPDARNKRAVKCYQNVGFKTVKKALCRTCKKHDTMYMVMENKH